MLVLPYSVYRAKYSQLLACACLHKVIASPSDAGPISSAGVSDTGSASAAALALMSSPAPRNAQPLQGIVVHLPGVPCKILASAGLCHTPQRHRVAGTGRADQRNRRFLHRQPQRTRIAGDALRLADDADALELCNVRPRRRPLHADVAAQVGPHRAVGAGEIRVHPVERVDARAVVDHLDMQVRPVAVAGLAGIADQVALLDRLPRLDENPGKMAVPGAQAAALVGRVMDAQHIAVALHSVLVRPSQNCVWSTVPSSIA